MTSGPYHGHPLIDPAYEDDTPKEYYPIIWSRPDGSQMSISLYKRFGRTGFQVGVGGLVGCTVLVIVNREGVYAAHYWEDPSIHADHGWCTPSQPYTTRDGWFQGSVIWGLVNGIRGEQAPLNGRNFTGNDVEAVLMRPETTYNPRSPQVAEEYNQRWATIRQTVAAIVPALHDEHKWHVVKYARGGTPFPAKGTLIVDYDVRSQGSYVTRKSATVWAELNIPIRCAWNIYTI